MRAIEELDTLVRYKRTDMARAKVTDLRHLLIQVRQQEQQVVIRTEQAIHRAEVMMEKQRAARRDLEQMV